MGGERESSGHEEEHVATQDAGTKDLAVVDSPTLPPEDSQKGGKVMTRRRQRQEDAPDQNKVDEDEPQQAAVEDMDDVAKEGADRLGSPDGNEPLNGQGDDRDGVSIAGPKGSPSQQATKRKGGEDIEEQKPGIRVSKRLKGKTVRFKVDQALEGSTGQVKPKPTGEVQIETKIAKDSTPAASAPNKSALRKGAKYDERDLANEFGGAKDSIFEALVDSKLASAEAALENLTRAMSQKPARASSLNKEEVKKEMLSGLIKCENISEDLENFPYYLGECVKAHLLSVFAIHLQHFEYACYTKLLLPLTNRVLLTGPTGTEICREKLIMALAKNAGADVLVFDGEAIPSSIDSQSSGGIGKLPRPSLGLDGEKLLSSRSSREAGKDGHHSRSSKRLPRRIVSGVEKLVTNDAADGTGKSAVGGGAATGSTAVATASPTATATRQTRRSTEGDKAATSTDAVLAGLFFPRRASLMCSSRQSGGLPSAGTTGGRSSPAESRPAAGGSRAAGAGEDLANGVNSTAGAHLGLPLKSSKAVHFRDADAMVASIKAEMGRADDDDHVYMDALVDVTVELSKERPCVLFIKDADKSLSLHADRCTALLKRLEECAIPRRFVLIASQSAYQDRRYRGHEMCCSSHQDRGLSSGMVFPKLGSISKSGLLDLTFFDYFGRLDDRGKEAPRSPKPFTKLFANRIALHAPVAKEALEEWKRRIDEDTALMRADRNRKILKQALKDAGIECGEISALAIRDQTLTSELAEKLVSWAVSHHVIRAANEQESIPQRESAKDMEEDKDKQNDKDKQEDRDKQVDKDKQEANGKEDLKGKEEVKVEEEVKDKQEPKEKQEDKATAKSSYCVDMKALEYGVDMLNKATSELQVSRPALKDFVTDNEYERRLLTEVIPPNEVGVNFDDIGALDKVKDTLQELVMLPLQRPELFTKGQLTRPCKGILLFGPPGSGKTMLAKAVATEAGANFINISMSTIASKWFGEGEKVVKAVFSLASRIAPSVIFIDEVDSMLGRRERPGEHEAMRKIKNEFMANWDGLRTRDNERVIVLAATNRPFDLDDAVIRRLPRRLMVDLPDADNRAKILKVILAKEELDEAFDFEELATATEGYSGSDLKNLCVAAAYRPIRELLTQEKQAKAKAEKPPPATIRPLKMEDMREARAQVSASVSMDATSMAEIKTWNEQFGEGGTRRRDTLSYFT